jgi:hypothetical protein
MRWVRLGCAQDCRRALLASWRRVNGFVLHTCRLWYVCSRMFSTLRDRARIDDDLGQKCDHWRGRSCTPMHTVSPTGSIDTMDVIPTGAHANLDLWNHNKLLVPRPHYPHRLLILRFEFLRSPLQRNGEPASSIPRSLLAHSTSPARQLALVQLHSYCVVTFSPTQKDTL